MSSPWKIGPSSGDVQVSSLNEIMSEELATSLQKREEQAEELGITVEELPEPVAGGSAEDPECSDDLLLATLLQHEFDREHDVGVARAERSLNGADKISVSLAAYRQSHPLDESDSEEDDPDFREVQNLKIYNEKNPIFPPSGVMKQKDGSYVTKHDKTINGRSNARKVMQLPPGINTGDAVGDDVKLSNKVYNALKRHSTAESNRRMKLHEKKDASTSELAVDAKTRLLLFKMLDSDMLASISGSVSTGKEANVFHAYGGAWEQGTKPVPPELALKIYKTTLNEFKNRIEYIKDDYRFRNPRKVLKIWAEKELLNLNRMRRAEMRCPSVFKLKGHVLMMSFIGGGGRAAPQLRDALLEDDAAVQSAYEEVVEGMRTMYKKCQLVHADLSEFNLLYHEGHVWFIDVSQAVDLSHPKALLFLARDCDRVTNFFRRQGLEELASPRELFIDLTGIEIHSDEKFFSEVQEYQLENRAVQQRKDKKNPADATLRLEQEEQRAYEELAEELLHNGLDQ